MQILFIFIIAYILGTFGSYYHLILEEVTSIIIMHLKIKELKLQDIMNTLSIKINADAENAEDESFEISGFQPKEKD